MQTIRNLNELQKAVKPVLETAANKMADTVYACLQDFLHQYYDVYTPSVYKRSYAFLKSAVKIRAAVHGTTAVAVVYIDTNSMRYEEVSGFQVAVWANQGLHGGLNVEADTPHVWDDAIDAATANGRLLYEAVQYLRSKGYNIEI